MSGLLFFCMVCSVAGLFTVLLPLFYLEYDVAVGFLVLVGMFTFILIGAPIVYKYAGFC